MDIKISKSVKKRRLVRNWKTILKKAWSIRLMLLAAILTGLQTILPMFTPQEPSPLFALLTFVVIVLAMIVRCLAQQDLDD